MSQKSKIILKTIILLSVYFLCFLALEVTKPEIVLAVGCGFITDNLGTPTQCTLSSEADPWACGIFLTGVNNCGGGAGPHGCYVTAGGVYGTTDCNLGNFECQTAGCPNESGLEGNMCLLADSRTGPLNGQCYWEKEGYWDKEESVCITCNGPLQWRRVADTGRRCFECQGTSWAELGCATDIVASCETACDAGIDPVCDEKMPGQVCDVEKICDNTCHCAIGSPSICGDGKVDAAAGEKCDPGDPTNGIPADDAACPGKKCQSNCQCTSASSSSSCPCAEGACPIEMRGGLIPCGRTCDDPTTPENECCPCTFCHLFVLLERIINLILIKIVPPLAVLMLVIGGALFLIPSGNPALINQGKNIIKTTIIALLIIYGAWLIVNSILALLGVNSWVWPSGGWFEVNCPVP